MTLAGVWENQYGSRMELDVEGNLVRGTYASTTGSTGQYVVSGWQAVNEPNEEAGQPVALCIEWRSVVEGPSDPSWNWASGFGGQVSRINGEDVLILAHLLVASSDFDGIAPQGIYPDKLTYRRVGQAPTIPTEMMGRGVSPISDRAAGVWIAQDGACLELVVTPASESRFGHVTGALNDAGAVSEIAGLTDINAPANGLALQSIALAALDGKGSTALAFAGTLRLSDDTLDLYLLVNRATPPGSTYVQTSMRAVRFNRINSDVVPSPS